MSTSDGQLAIVESRAAPSSQLQFKHVAVILLLGAVCVALWRIFPLSSKDLWTHLKFGEWICSHRSLPEREPFCAPPEEAQELTHTQWLTQAAFYQIFRLGERVAGGSEINRLAGGVEMLRLTLALLVLARMIVLLIAYRRISGSLTWGLIALSVSLLLTWTNLVELRPHVVGEVFFACLLMLLSRPIPSRATTIIVPPLFVLWANCHASFLGGLALIALCLIARLLDRSRFELSLGDLIRRDRRLHRLAIMLVVSIVATGFLNPHGWRIFDRILTVDGHANMLALAEWQPLRMELAFGWHWIFLGSMLVAIITHLLSPTGFSAGDMLLLFAFAAAGCMQQHMLVWWAMMLPWVLLPHWVACASGPNSQDRSDCERISRNRTATSIAAGIVLGALVVSSPIFTWLRNGQPAALDQSLDADTPWALCLQLQAEPSVDSIAFPQLHEFLEKNYPNGRFHGMIMVAPRMGDFFVWRGLPVPVCSQLYWFKAKYWADLEPLLQCQPGWWETFDVREVNMIVLGPDDYPELRRRIEADQGWQVLHRPGPLPDPRHGNFAGWIALRKKPIEY